MKLYYRLINRIAAILEDNVLLYLAVVLYSPEWNHSTFHRQSTADTVDSSVFIYLLVLHLPPFFGNVISSACLLSLEAAPPLTSLGVTRFLNTLFIPGLSCHKQVGMGGGLLTLKMWSVFRTGCNPSSVHPHLLNGTSEEPPCYQLPINWVKLVKVAQTKSLSQTAERKKASSSFSYTPFQQRLDWVLSVRASVSSPPVSGCETVSHWLTTWRTGRELG